MLGAHKPMCGYIMVRNACICGDTRCSMFFAKVLPDLGNHPIFNEVAMPRTTFRMCIRLLSVYLRGLG